MAREDRCLHEPFWEFYGLTGSELQAKIALKLVCDLKFASFISGRDGHDRGDRVKFPP